MLLEDRPTVVSVLVVWSAAHTIPGVLVALEVGGVNGAIVWLLVAMQVTLAVGLFLGWAFVSHVLVVELALNVLVLSLIAWAVIFAAAAWGVHAQYVPFALGTFAYLLFLGWAFIAFFHPSAREHFQRGHGEAPEDLGTL